MKYADTAMTKFGWKLAFAGRHVQSLLQIAWFATIISCLFHEMLATLEIDLPSSL